jgi:hypothetical protein
MEFQGDPRINIYFSLVLTLANRAMATTRVMLHD